MEDDLYFFIDRRSPFGFFLGSNPRRKERVPRRLVRLSDLCILIVIIRQSHYDVPIRCMLSGMIRIDDRGSINGHRILIYVKRRVLDVRD